MRIACPSCSATYDVPDSLMTAGRVVRCARCGGEWTPVAGPAVADTPEPEPEAPAPVEAPAAPLPDTAETSPAAPPRPRLSAMDRLAAHAVPRQSSSRLRLAWLGSAAVLVLLGVAAVAWRTEIVAGWPPSARAYAVFGLHPSPPTQ